MPKQSISRLTILLKPHLFLQLLKTQVSLLQSLLLLQLHGLLGVVGLDHVLKHVLVENRVHVVLLRNLLHLLLALYHHRLILRLKGLALVVQAIVDNLRIKAVLVLSRHRQTALVRLQHQLLRQDSLRRLVEIHPLLVFVVHWVLILPIIGWILIHLYIQMLLVRRQLQRPPLVGGHSLREAVHFLNGRW